MPVGNWARGAELRIVGELHGSITNNVFHFGTDEVVSDEGSLDTVIQQLAEAMLECAITTLLPVVSQDWKLLRVEATRVFPVRADPFIATAPENSVGALGPTSVSFAASLLNLRTGIGGRRGRGKKFLPPAGEANITASELDAGMLALLAAFAACVASKFMGATPDTFWHLGIYSRVDGGTKFQNFNTGFRVVSSINPQQVVARCGSRKKFVGA